MAGLYSVLVVEVGVFILFGLLFAFVSLSPILVGVDKVDNQLTVIQRGTKTTEVFCLLLNTFKPPLVSAVNDLSGRLLAQILLLSLNISSSYVKKTTRIVFLE